MSRAWLLPLACAWWACVIGFAIFVAALPAPTWEIALAWGWSVPSNFAWVFLARRYA